MHNTYKINPTQDEQETTMELKLSNLLVLLEERQYPQLVQDILRNTRYLLSTLHSTETTKEVEFRQALINYHKERARSLPSFIQQRISSNSIEKIEDFYRKDFQISVKSYEAVIELLEGYIANVEEGAGMQTYDSVISHLHRAALIYHTEGKRLNKMKSTRKYPAHTTCVKVSQILRETVGVLAFFVAEMKKELPHGES